MVLMCHVFANELKCGRLSKPPPGVVSHGLHVAYTFSSHPPSIDTPPPPPLIFSFLASFPPFSSLFSFLFPFLPPCSPHTCLDIVFEFKKTLPPLQLNLPLHHTHTLFSFTHSSLFSPSSKKTHILTHSLLRPTHKKPPKKISSSNL